MKNPITLMRDICKSVTSFCFQSQNSALESTTSYHTCESSKNSSNSKSSKSTDLSNDMESSVGESALSSDSQHDQSTSPLCRGQSLKKIPRYEFPNSDIQ